MALPDMQCQELVEVITAFLDGTLPRRDRARFEAHLVTCPHCRLYLKQMRDTIGTLRGLDDGQIADADKRELLTLFRGWHGSEM